MPGIFSEPFCLGSVNRVSCSEVSLSIVAGMPLDRQGVSLWGRGGFSDTDSAQVRHTRRLGEKSESAEWVFALSAPEGAADVRVGIESGGRVLPPLAGRSKPN